MQKIKLSASIYHVNYHLKETNIRVRHKKEMNMFEVLCHEKVMARFGTLGDVIESLNRKIAHIENGMHLESLIFRSRVLRRRTVTSMGKTVKALVCIDERQEPVILLTNGKKAEGSIVRYYSSKKWRYLMCVYRNVYKSKLFRLKSCELHEYDREFYAFNGGKLNVDAIRKLRRTW